MLIAGAFIAFLVGSGFATGQEIMQYFVGYGYAGVLGAGIVFAVFVYVGLSFVSAGHHQQFQKGNDVYAHYCGKYVGRFYDYFSVVFIYMSFMVMVGGAGATLHQQYDLPVHYGGIGIAVVAGVTVLFGLSNIVNVIGAIAPVICVGTILLGVAGMLLNPSGLASADEAIAGMDLLRASPHWLSAAMSYVGFCMLWLAAFMSQIGKNARTGREARLGAVLGAFGFSLAVVVITLGLMANIDLVAGSLVPSLALAGKLHPLIGTLFSLAVYAAIYTTAVPLLWLVVARVVPDDKSRAFKTATVLLAAAGTLIALQVPFDRLINIVYVLNGYVGICLLAFMLIKDITGTALPGLLRRLLPA